MNILLASFLPLVQTYVRINSSQLPFWDQLPEKLALNVVLHHRSSLSLKFLLSFPFPFKDSVIAILF